MINSGNIKISDPRVAVNEYVTKYLIQRLQKLLIQNDLSINDFYKYFCRSGPGIYQPGVVYQAGYKVWADGMVLENGEYVRKFGIFISLHDDNLYDPETEAGAAHWKRFSMIDVRDGNSEIFKIIARYLNNHIVKKHVTSDYEQDNTKLFRTLQNIAIYAHCSTAINLSKYTVYRTSARSDDNMLLVYDQQVPATAEQQTLPAQIAVSHVANANSASGYTQQNANANLLQVLNAGDWMYYVIKLDGSAIYKDTDYKILVSTQCEGAQAIPYVVEQQRSSFSIAIHFDGASESSYDLKSLRFKCVGTKA